ncbi:hypothetical protein [Shinella zoogloeoides]|uniref:hypothetical protein n=1 Tax=Shinella zoogloeoides TaxID=352475 RepID=UPI00273F6F3F|nr:hypothetical protein [Shinella zoogloeoides]WLR94227.1 hypothetical protein Q9316_08690 [Shinella zoogloeoides]
MVLNPKDHEALRSALGLPYRPPMSNESQRRSYADRLSRWLYPAGEEILVLLITGLATVAFLVAAFVIGW